VAAKRTEGDLRDAEKKTVERARSLRKTMTKSEVILWQNLRREQLGGFKFRRQVPVGPFVADFACVELKLIVEVDGATHAEDNEISYDAQRTRFLEAQGWRVLRVLNTDIYEGLDGVLELLRLELEELKAVK
jgi:very-short-patch-repair endonuclease